MTILQDAIAQAARELIGVRFRPQGRDAAFGLDCIGVVIEALAAAGHDVAARADYPQRGGSPEVVASAMSEAGLRRIDGAAIAPGDVVLMRSGPAQLHLGVVTARGLVHADAGLRRVVETPGAPRWPVLAGWRCEETG